MYVYVCIPYFRLISGTCIAMYQKICRVITPEKRIFFLSKQKIVLTIKQYQVIREKKRFHEGFY